MVGKTQIRRSDVRDVFRALADCHQIPAIARRRLRGIRVIPKPVLKRLASAAAVLTLAGCSYNLQLMARDSGESGSGTAAYGQQTGAVNIKIGDQAYTGTWASARMNDSFTLLNTYGRNSRGTSATGTGFGQSYSSGSAGRALLRSSSGAGLRCEFQTGGSAGYGVCQNDQGKLYDMLISKY